jgi:hypothetical protein
MFEQSWRDDPLMMKFLSTTSNNNRERGYEQQIIDDSFKILEEFKEEQA